MRSLLRWISRLFLFGLIAGAIGFVVSRLKGQDDEDFEDFDDLDSNFEFQETPVEIDVAVADLSSDMEAQEAGASSDTDSDSTTSMSAPDTIIFDEASEDGAAESPGDGSNADVGRLIAIAGIGPVYEARLHTLGIHDVNDLANSDPNVIAEKMDVIGGLGEVEKWITQARSMIVPG